MAKIFPKLSVDFPSDRGDVVGTALVFPLFLAIFMLVVHLSVWYLARHVVNAAAWEALRSAQLEDADLVEAQGIGEATLSLSAAVSDGTVVITEVGDDIRVEVTADVSTIPVLGDSISVSITGPKEQLVLETDP